MSAHLSADGKLRSQLQLRYGPAARGGFGQAWVIEPDGSWSVAAVQEGVLCAPLRQGRLSGGQLAALAHHLAAQDLDGLPDRIDIGGGMPQWSLRITCGGKMAQLLADSELPDLSELLPPAGGEHAGEWSRLVALALVIQHWTRGAGPGDWGPPWSPEVV